MIETLTGKWMRVPMVVFVALLLQVSLLTQLRLGGVTGDVMLLVAITAGLIGGPEIGAVVGFVAGMAFDSVLQTPFGLSALAYCLTAYLAGRLHTGVLQATWWTPVVTTAAFSALGVTVYALGSVVLGDTHSVDLHLLRIVGVIAALNGALSPLGMRTMRWTLGVAD